MLLRSFRGVAAFIATLCLLTLSSSRADTALRTLSESDGGYKLLEELQRALCNASPTHRCVASAEDCVSGLANVFSRNMNKNVAEEQARGVCSVRGTHYEVPGTYWLLRQRFDEISEIAGNLGVKLPNKIIYGTAVAPEINAEVALNSKRGVSMILINVELVEFVNEFTKLVVESLPYEWKSGRYSFELSDKAREEKIANSPKLRRRLVALLDRYLEGERLKRFEVREATDGMVSAYTKAIGTFVFAHEIGHIYYGHGPSKLNLGMLRRQFVGWPILKAPRITPVVQEIEADNFAAPFIIYRRDKDDPKSILRGMELKAIEFFFITQMLLEQAAYFKDNNTFPPKMPPIFNNEDVTKVAECAMRADCRARDIPGLSRSLLETDSHPPHRFRALVMRRISENHPPSPEDEPWEVVGEAINRNAELLWGVTWPEYQELLFRRETFPNMRDMPFIGENDEP